MITPVRRIVYDLLLLSFPVRYSILLKLDLVTDDDVGVDDVTLVRRALERAKERGALETLAQELQLLATVGNI